jgi:hypothetical protein
MKYKKGQPVTISVNGSTRRATVDTNGVLNGKVRVKPAGFPFAISILESQII